METLALVNAGVGLLETLIPNIAKLVQSGEITPEQQATVRARYLSLRAAGDAAFTGPEWELSTKPTATTPTKA